jgi:hypothetical protein
VAVQTTYAGGLTSCFLAKRSGSLDEAKRIPGLTTPAESIEKARNAKSILTLKQHSRPLRSLQLKILQSNRNGGHSPPYYLSIFAYFAAQRLCV